MESEARVLWTLAVIVVGSVIAVTVVTIKRENEANKRCYPQVNIERIEHGEHSFAVCTSEGGPVIRFIK